jgi:DNA helicase IV
LGAALSNDDQKIVLLTGEQYHILEAFREWKRVAVAGGAGTGKTLLAAEEARRRSREGLNTLLLCYNRPLAGFLKQCFKESPKPNVHSFHEFCGMMAAAAKITLPEIADQRLLYTKLLPDVLVKALEIRPDLRYDAIIVDEAQDFLADWWPPIELCMRSESEGILYVFYDANQRVYPTSGQFVTALPQSPVMLSRNIRNAKPIFDLSRQLYTGSRYLSAGPEGTPVEYEEIASSANLRERLGQVVGRICVTEKIPPEDVAILSGMDRAASMVAGLPRVGRFDTVSAEDPRAGALTVDTIRRFKGLERPVVLLVEVSDILDVPELLYVAVTRARLKLLMIGTGRELGDLRNLLQELPPRQASLNTVQI